MRNSLYLFTLLVLSLTQSAHAQQSYNYVSVAYPNAQQTTLTGIDSAGNSVGWYQVTDSSLPIGFVRLVSGQIVLLPGPAGAEGSEVNGLSDSGVAVGEFFSGTSEIISGFIYGHGTYKTLNYDGFPTNNTGISTNNLTVGIFTLNGAFQRNASGQAQLLPDLNGSAVAPFGINSKGVIVGSDQYSAIKDVRSDGFVLTPDGVYETLDYPGAWYTYLWGINNAGTVVGSYKLQDGYIGGFVYSKAQFTPIGYPSIYPTNSTPSGINASGVIVGGYIGSDYIGRGFIATPVE